MIELELQSVSKSYGLRKVLDNIDLQARSGELVWLTGHNGAGKTTLLRLISTLIKPTSGQLFYSTNGARETLLSKRQEIATFFRPLAVFEQLTVKENLDFFTKLHDSNQSIEISRRLDLKNVWSIAVEHLSTGFQQRLALAQCFLADKPILLLDEPLQGLDKDGSKMVLEMLKGMLSAGKLIFVASHRSDAFAELATKKLELYSGKWAK